MMKQLLFVILFSAPLFGQLTGNAQLVLFPGAPTGSCTSRQMGLNQSSGSLYVCVNSAWQVVAGGGGGAGLQGCSTPSSGNLVCDSSVQGGVGNVGMLTMPWSSSGLPAPPNTTLAAIAPDATGHLFWSPGNSTPFTAIGAGGGGGTGTATALQFSQTTFGLSAVAPGDGECLAVSQGTIVGAPCGGGGVGVSLGGVTIIE